MFTESHLEDLEEQRHSPSVRARHQRYAARLDADRGETILDVGCGTGDFSRRLAAAVGPTGHVFGVDIALEAVKLARQLTGVPLSEICSFSRADGERLPFDNGTFDAAVCISVLSFCEHPDRVLSEIHRVLRPGGRLLAANSDEDQRIYNCSDIELGRALMRAISDRANHPWIGRRLAFLMRQAGFELSADIVETNVERRFAPGYAGYINARSFSVYLTGTAGISAAGYSRWINDLEACDREGSYCYSVTTYACLGSA